MQPVPCSWSGDEKSVVLTGDWPWDALGGGTFESGAAGWVGNPGTERATRTSCWGRIACMKERLEKAEGENEKPKVMYGPEFFLSTVDLVPRRKM